MHLRLLIDFSDKIKICLLILSFLIIFTASAEIPVVANTFDIQFNQATNSESNGYSVTLMIGDGMGFEHVKAGRWIEVGTEGALLHMEQLPIHGEVNTSSLDSTEINPIDSAAAAIAMATGNKTYKGRVSTTPEGEPLPTILEYAEELEKAT